MQLHPAKPQFALLLCASLLLVPSVSGPACAQSYSGKVAQRSGPPGGVRAAVRTKVSPLNSTGGADAFRPKDPNSTPANLVADGYCLVSLRDQLKWIQGNPKIELIINGKLYLFAGIRQRDIFAARPEQYLPVLDGDSIVAFAETGKRKRGNLQFGMTFRERLYFFQSNAEQTDFQSHPERFLNADLVDQGFCPVSKLEEQKLTPGFPETVLTLDGLRHCFASAMHRKIFAANPQRYVDSTDATARDLQVRVGSSGGLRQQLGLSANSMARASKSRDEESSQDPPFDNDASELETDNYVRPAISGYCPVSIRKEGVWVRGKTRYKAVFDGKVYHMAGTAEMNLFRENPSEFIPVLGGDSIVSFADKSLRVAGSAYQPLIAGDRLYLFADATEKQAFKDNPAHYENADLAFNGNCVATQVEDEREVPGLPEFETIFQGLRYRFASQELMEKFLAEPAGYVEQLPVAQ